MGKKKPKEWSNVSYKTWGYEGQTEMKHKVLSYYLPLWIQILGKYNMRLNFVDGFGGIGAYHTKEDLENKKYISKSFGSPVLSIKTINNLVDEGRVQNVSILIIDDEQKNIDNIKQILDDEKINYTNVEFRCGNFDTEINKILDELNNNIAPTFFLIDPFGFSQIKMKTIERIMKIDKTEILLNFMYNAIQRFVEIKEEKLKKALEKSFNDLFGCEDWKNYIGKRTTEKETRLVELFRNQCKNFAGYVYPFPLSFPDKAMPYYYLFHLSNHWKGCALMKDSFARFNMGNLEYKGKNINYNQLNLFAQENNKIEKQDWEEYLFANFAGKSIPFEKLLSLIIDLVPFTVSGIRKAVQYLEKKGTIRIDGGGRKRKGGIIDEDIVIFNS